MKYIIEIAESHINKILPELTIENGVISLEKISDEKAEILLNIKEAFKEMKRVEEGKSKARPAREFLNEI